MFKCAIMDLLDAGIYPSPAQIQKHTGRKVTNNLSGQQCKWRRDVMDYWCLKNPEDPNTKKWRKNRVGAPDLVWLTEKRICAACNEPIRQAARLDRHTEEYVEKVWLTLVSEDDDPIWSKDGLCAGYQYQERHTPNMKAELDKISNQLDAILAR